MRDAQPGTKLPASRYFVAIMRGDRVRTCAVRPGVLYVLMVLLPILALWCAVSTLYLFFHDDLMAGLMSRQTRMQYGYESRLADLRNQIDQLTSQDGLDRRSIDSRMQALLTRQSELQSHAAVIAAIATETGLQPGPRTGGALSRFAPTPASDATGALNAISTATGTPAAALPADVSDFAEVGQGQVGQGQVGQGQVGQGQVGQGQVGQGGSGQGAPPRLVVRPMSDGDSPLLGPRSERDGPRYSFDVAALSSGSGARERIDRILRPIAVSIDRLEAEQMTALAGLGDRARETTARFDVAVADAGLSLGRFHAGAGAAAVGGPLVPLSIDAKSPAFDRQVYAWQDSFAAMARIEGIAGSIPFHCPFEKAVAMTSGFGPRLDPFTGRAAMHTGADFAMDYGAPVHATAGGRVTIAGAEGGYGNMVEVDHGNGLSTRYGHMSAILVTPGQTIAVGAIVGIVGATGRATGPHLHYETRIDGEAVDPVRFLKAGLRLYAANTAPVR